MACNLGLDNGRRDHELSTFVHHKTFGMSSVLTFDQKTFDLVTREWQRSSLNHQVNEFEKVIILLARSSFGIEGRYI